MTQTPSPRRWRRPLVAALLLGGLVAAPLALAHGRGGPGCHGGPDGDPQAHLDRMVEHGLDAVDATDAQRATVEAAVAGLGPDLARFRDEGRALHEELRDALSAPTVDPAKVEAIRADGLDLADEASARMLGVMVKVAQALTPEQRAELAEMGPPRGERGGPGHHPAPDR